MSTLAILMTIFSVASHRIMSQMLAQRQMTGRVKTAFCSEINRVTQTVFLQGVGGLIDLNTAAPEVLERLVETFDLEPDAMTDYIAWRRLLRVTGAGQGRLAELLAVATVHSGRRGIAPDVAPQGVLAILEQDELPPAWLSPPSGANYAVVLEEGDGSPDWVGARRASGGGWEDFGGGLRKTGVEMTGSAEPLAAKSGVNNGNR